jgi:hypothetical protein
MRLDRVEDDEYIRSLSNQPTGSKQHDEISRDSIEQNRSIGLLQVRQNPVSRSQATSLQPRRTITTPTRLAQPLLDSAPPRSVSHSVPPSAPLRGSPRLRVSPEHDGPPHGLLHRPRPGPRRPRSRSASPAPPPPQPNRLTPAQPPPSPSAAAPRRSVRTSPTSPSTATSTASTPPSSCASCASCRRAPSSTSPPSPPSCATSTRASASGTTPCCSRSRGWGRRAPGGRAPRRRRAS